jgi:hypothetical protein
VTSQLFTPDRAQEKAFGHPYNGRYHMPLLPGEEGTKTGGDWVPYGVTRMTNIAGALEDTRALSVWEQGMMLIGLALSQELHEELVLLVQQAESEGVIFELLRDYKDLKEALAGAPHDQGKQQVSIAGRAKERARAGAAAQRGTNRHTAWEHRAKTSQLIGTPAIQASVLDTERLLAEAGLERVPGLSERVVRNTEINAVGKFDDVLRETSTGRFLMADLKTKATPWFSMTAVDAQLAGYARAAYMLTEDGRGYERGPLWHVDQSEGVILHTPSDGSPARLERADLENGWRCALLAAEVLERRAFGKSAERMSRVPWVGKDLEIAS